MCYCTESFSKRRDKCTTGCIEFSRLPLICGDGLSEGRQLFIRLLHVTLADKYTCFYNGCYNALGILAQLQTAFL